MRRTLNILLVGALCAGFLYSASIPASAEPVPKDATWTQLWFPSVDGTMLHADLFLPKDLKKGEKIPAIVSIGPYFGSGGDPTEPTPQREGPVMRFQDLIDEGRIFERGYAYVQVDSRGYGGSDGCSDFGGPGEQTDAKAAVEWAATQDWSNGKVGMWGKSYDAWTQVMALSQKPKGLAAAVIQSPIIDGYRTLYQNGIHYGSTWVATPGLYAGYDLVPPSLNDSPPEEFIYPVKGTATNPHCYAINLSMTKVPERGIPYWEERNIVKAAAKSDVPVLWSHGFRDANTKPDNFLDVYSHLRGPTRAWFGQYEHDRGNEVDKVGRDGFMDEAMAWFDHYLKGLPLKRYPIVEVQDSTGKWRTESQWPPADGSYYGLPIKAGTYQDNRGNTASSGIGSWTFTQPAPYDLHFAGVPKLTVEVDTQVPRANLVALVYDVDPKGSARMITESAYLLREEGKISFELYPQDWKLAKGHRIGILLSGSDNAWYLHIPTNTQVGVLKGSLSLPFLRFERTSNLAGDIADAMLKVPVIMELPKDVIADRTLKAKFPPPLQTR